MYSLYYVFLASLTHSILLFSLMSISYGYFQPGAVILLSLFQKLPVIISVTRHSPLPTFSHAHTTSATLQTTTNTYITPTFLFSTAVHLHLHHHTFICSRCHFVSHLLHFTRSTVIATLYASAHFLA